MKVGKIIFLLLLLISISIQSQSQIDQYISLVKQYESEQNWAQAANYSNKAAFYYWNNNNSSQAIHYFQKSIDFNTKIGNRNALIVAYNSLGAIYSDQQQYSQALNAFNKALKFSRKSTPINRLQSLVNTANGYANTGNISKAITHLEEAIPIAIELKKTSILKNCYCRLSHYYERTGNTSKQNEYFELCRAFEDRAHRDEIKEHKEKTSQAWNLANEARKEVQTKEDSLKKTARELENTKDSLTLAEQLAREKDERIRLDSLVIQEKESRLTTEKRIRWLLILVILIILVSAFLLYRQFNQKKKAYCLLEEKNIKIAKQNEYIKAGIRYAKTIQNAILPDEKFIEDYFQNFILYYPKDIVSGDFFWFSPIDSNKYIVSVIDCTGHGVPGAFMSLIGNRLLNEIIKEKKITDPAGILKMLNRGVIEELNQEHTHNMDGMDMVICQLEKINETKHKVIFAGAKNHLYYYTAGKTKMIKGDRQAIGGVIQGINKKAQYTNHELELNKDDMLYLLSDGYTDQQNPERERLGRRKLLKLIEKNAQKDITQQKQIFNDALKKHQQNELQRDDITFMALKL